MKTTEVVVELVVVGSGVAGIVALHLARDELSAQLIAVENHPVLFGLAVFVVCYVAGIVVDRFADLLFSPIEDWIRCARFDSVEEFQRFRVECYESSERARSWSDYNRVRARVCRGWTLNFVLAAAYVFIFNTSILSASLWTLGVLIFLTLFSWYRLASGEVRALAALYANEPAPS